MSDKPKHSYKNIIITFGPALLLIGLGFWVTSFFISPAPPKLITITTGSEIGAYYQFAQYYRDELAKQGIELKILTSSGSEQNIQRLLSDQADVAFVQGGIGEQQQELQSLGSLYYEPIWIFLNQRVQVQQLADVQGLRIATGAKGSGTQDIANILLQLNQIDDKTAQLLNLPSTQAAEQILAHKIDVAFFVSSPKSPLIQQLLNDPRAHLLSLNRADAYSHLLPYLSKIKLAEGIIDLQKNIPHENIEMIAPTANLVIKENFHSALQVLLLQAIKKQHDGPGIFSQPGDFPNTKKTAFPLSDVAARFYEVGPPFLMRYLPFWAAIFLDRMVVFLIPLLALLFPLIKVMPPIYRWRIRSSIYRWYKELQEVDDATFSGPMDADKQARLSKELQRIEEEVNKIQTPLSYADQVYNLLLHIDLVKKKIKP